MAAVLPPGWGGDGMLAMTTVWFALRADVRRRWPALLSLAVLLGLIGGVVLTAAAGARRTDTAYPRLLTWANASQVDIVPENTGFHRVLQGARPAAARRGDDHRLHLQRGGVAA